MPSQNNGIRNIWHTKFLSIFPIHRLYFSAFYRKHTSGLVFLIYFKEKHRNKYNMPHWLSLILVNKSIHLSKLLWIQAYCNGSHLLQEPLTQKAGFSASGESACPGRPLPPSPQSHDEATFLGQRGKGIMLCSTLRATDLTSGSTYLSPLKSLLA